MPKKSISIIHPNRDEESNDDIRRKVDFQKKDHFKKKLHELIIDSGLAKDELFAAINDEKQRFETKQISGPQPQDSIPINIFNSELAVLEAIVKYLRENINLTYNDIGKKLGRDHGPIGITYRRAKKKHPLRFDYLLIASGQETVPLKIFSGDSHPPLEAIVVYLKQKTSRNYSQIARLLNLDPRTVWTSYSRYKSKMRGSDAR